MHAFLLVPSRLIATRPLTALAMLACVFSGTGACADPARASLCTPVGNWRGAVEGMADDARMAIHEDRSGTVTFGPVEAGGCVEDLQVVEQAQGFAFAARASGDPACQGVHGSVSYDPDCEHASGSFVNDDGSGGQASWSREPNLTVRRDSLTAYRVSRSVYADLDHLSYASTLIAGVAGPSLEADDAPPRRQDVRDFKLVPHLARATPQPGGMAQLGFELDTIDGPVVDDARRAASFGMSCYMLALEADYGTPPLACKSTRIHGVVYVGAVRDPYGLPGEYCSAFIANVRLQGSARLSDGSFVHYEGNPPRIFRIEQPLAADGTPLVAGRTVARDPAVVRGRNVAMTLDGIGEVRANDRGGAIKGYRIDLYNGAGAAACRGYANPTLIGVCVTPQDACPGI